MTSECSNKGPEDLHLRVEEAVCFYQDQVDKTRVLSDSLVHAITERVYRALTLPEVELMHAAADLDSYAIYQERFDDYGYGDPVVKRFSAAREILCENGIHTREEAERLAIDILRSMVAAGEVRVDVARLSGGGLMKNVLEEDELQVAVDVCVQAMAACLEPRRDGGDV